MHTDLQNSVLSNNQTQNDLGTTVLVSQSGPNDLGTAVLVESQPVMQDALISDPTLQSTLNQQVCYIYTVKPRYNELGHNKVPVITK